MKKNPTLERTYEMILGDRKLRSKVFKINSHFGYSSKAKARKIAKSIYEKGLKK